MMDRELIMSLGWVGWRVTGVMRVVNSTRILDGIGDSRWFLLISSWSVILHRL
jgi:hypothetical protein